MQTAYYEPSVLETIKIGQPAIVFKVIHPDKTIKGDCVITSIVQSYNDKSGIFTTENTRYIPFI